MSIASYYRLTVAALWHCLALSCALVLLAVPAAATTNHIKAELFASHPAASGDETTLIIHMQPEPGWHGYWLNPGDAGLGMQLDWKLPQGASVGEPRYPVPDTLLISGLMNHVYKDDYAVLVPFTMPANAKGGDRLPVSVKANWLACTDEVCVPESGELHTEVQVHSPTPSQGPLAIDPRMDEAWTSRLPAPLDVNAHFALSGDTVRFGIPLPAGLALNNPHLFVVADKVVDYAAPQSFTRAGDTLVVELQRHGISPVQPERISGVLRLNSGGDGLSFTAIPGKVPAAGNALGGAEPVALSALPFLVLGALAGGLLLNIMPCVFPILSLKAMSLARAGESERHARSEGLAYTAGVILACIGLGGILLVLRAAGQEVGWAFQLQEPGIIAALLLLVTAITANFLGLFDFTVPGFANKGAPQGAFATGVLAAFVATPCTGPFMAAAMGAALLLPVVPAITLFATLGLGLALPFLAIAFIPALRKRLPRPGPWMNTFRRWMALPMGLTALALLWLASRVGGVGFALACAFLAGALVLLLAFVGRRQRGGQAALRLGSLGLVAIVAVGFVLLPKPMTGSAAAGESILDPQPFSADALAAARTSGRPVFAWFTADWCLTCKVNEQVAIERVTTREAFEQAGVIVLRGDWTRRDPAITRYLTAHGAAGVPLYVWYPAGGGAAETLPQVLTPGMLADLTRN